MESSVPLALGMEIVARDFDSKIFGFKVGSIEFPGETVIDVKELVRRAQKEGYRLLYVRSLTTSKKKELDNPPVDVLGFQFVWGGALTKHRIPLASMTSLGPSQEHISSNKLQYARFSDDVENIPADLYDLMFLSGRKSRFNPNVDSNFFAFQFQAMYRKWLQNAVIGKTSDFVAVCYDTSESDRKLGQAPRIVGFYSAGKFNLVRDKGGKVLCVQIGKGDVAAVHPEYRGKRIVYNLYLLLCAHIMDVFGPTIYKRSCSFHTTHATNRQMARVFFKVEEHLVQSWSYYHLWLELPTIPFNRPFLSGMEATLVSQQLTPEGIKSNGQCSKKCLHKLSKALQPAEPLLFLTTSATSALEMAAMCIGISPGDEIIMPSFTFVSTASAFAMFGAVPVFIDSRPDTLNMNEKLIESAITNKTKAICIVHYAGIACEMDAILAIARIHDLHVIEDAAHGLGGAYKGQRLGTIGDIGCFSFHYTKDVISGEGGAIAINNKSLRKKACVIFEKGTNRNAMIDGKVAKYQWVSQGSSFAPSEIVAAALLAQLECWDEIHSSRLKILHLYHDFFGAALKKANLLNAALCPNTLNLVVTSFGCASKAKTAQTSKITF